MNATNPTPPLGGTARTGAEVRHAAEAVLADDAKKEEVLATALAAAAGQAEARDFLMRRFSQSGFVGLGEEASTAEKVATGCRLELVAGSARTWWLQAGTEEWQLENPTDEIQAFVRAAFSSPGQALVLRHRGDVITELEVRKASSSNP